MTEYQRVPRSFHGTPQHAAVVRDERSTAMFSPESSVALQADRERPAAWVDTQAWKYEQMREQRRYREAADRVVRAFAVRFAPVHADAVGRQGRLVVEHRG
jgi:hypothetical protein